MPLTPTPLTGDPAPSDSSQGTAAASAPQSAQPPPAGGNAGQQPAAGAADGGDQLVNVPGVGMLRFPGGMSQQDMAAAIQRNFPQLGTPNQRAAVANSAPFQPAAPSSAADFDAGAGKAFMDVGRGAKELLLRWGNKLGVVSGQHLAAYQRQLGQDQQQDAALMSTTGGKLGDLAGNVAMSAVAPEEAGLTGAVASGAATGGLQPTTGNQSQLQNAVIGGLGGAAGDIGGRVLGRVAQPIRNVLDDTRLQALQLLRANGVPVDVAQATGDKLAQTLKNAATDSPFINESKFPHIQQQAYNAAVLRTFGGDGTKATPAVMDRADRRLGAIFDDIASRNPVTVDQPLLDDLADIHTAADRELSATDAAPIRAQIDNAIDKAAGNDGKIDGKAYQNIRSSLGRLAQGNRNGSVSHFAVEIRGALDDALQRSVSPDDLDTLMRARTQYRAMKQVEGAIQSGTDDISPAALANSIDTKANASQSVYGRGDQTLVRLANAGKVILGKGTANSGTTRRFLGYMATGIGADAIYRLARGQALDKDEMMEAAIAGGFAPLGARALVESPAGRRWLTKWADSQIASRAAQGLLRSGRVLGSGGAPALSAQIATPQAPPSAQ